MITETSSQAPAQARRRHESGSHVENENASVHTRKPATEVNSARPARFHGGKYVVTSAIANAPAAGDARRRPRPSGPVCRMSFANAGKSAVTPPKRTAKRSSDNAGSRSGDENTKRTP